MQPAHKLETFGSISDVWYS